MATFEVKLTVDQKKAIAGKDIQERANDAERRLIESIKESFDQIWENKDGLTPQEVWDGLGTSAASIGRTSIIMQKTIWAIRKLFSKDPEFEFFVSTYSLKVNEDGSITVGDLKTEQEIAGEIAWLKS